MAFSPCPCPVSAQPCSSVSQANVAFFMTGSTLEIGFVGDTTDKVSVLNQSTAGNQIDEVDLNNGHLLTAADINTVIQDVTAYAAAHSITLNTIADVKGDTSLMAIINATWH